MEKYNKYNNNNNHNDDDDDDNNNIIIIIIIKLVGIYLSIYLEEMYPFG